MATKEYKPDQGKPRPYSDIPGIDPRADWLLGLGRREFLPNPAKNFIPTIIRIESNEAFAVIKGFFRRDGMSIQVLRSPRDFYIGDRTFVKFFDEEKQFVKAFTIVAYAKLSFFEDLRDPDLEDAPLQRFRRARKTIRLGAPIAEDAYVFYNSPRIYPIVEVKPDNLLDSTDVIVGIIDDGIGIANSRFRLNDDTTRVKCFWSMDGEPDSDFPPYDSQGRQYSEDKINKLLRDSTVAEIVDESLFYKNAKLIDHSLPHHQSLAWRVSHGTHVLDIAGGAGPEKNDTSRSIVAVQLPVRYVEKVHTGDLNSKIINAVDYIVEKSIIHSETPKPTVINISYGLYAGPHDGSGELERELQRMCDENPHVRIVLPSGNGNLARCHAEFSFKTAGDVVTIPWRIQPDDKTPNQVQVWLPGNFKPADSPTDSRVIVKLTAPNGVLIDAVEEGEVPDATPGPVAEVPVAAISYNYVEGNTNRGMFAINVNPTKPVVSDQTDLDAVSTAYQRAAMSGLWTIEITNRSLGQDEFINMWVERDDTVFGYKLFGRQSYFDDSEYVRFDERGDVLDRDPTGVGVSPVKRAGMLNNFTTAVKPIVVGAYRRNDNRIAFYSAGGSPEPTNTLGKNGPDALGVSDDSRVHAGTLAAGSRSGAKVAMNGTSVAAPAITRLLVSELIGDPDADADSSFVQVAAASHDPSTDAGESIERDGHGKLGLPERSQYRRLYIAEVT